MPPSNPLNKAQLLAISWGAAALFSFGLHSWGRWHPEPLLAPMPVVLLLVFSPALLLGGWLLNREKGESVDSDQECR